MEVKFASVVSSHGQTQPFLVKDKDSLKSRPVFFTSCNICHAFRKSGKKIESNYSSLHSPIKLFKRRVERNIFCVMKWTPMKVYYFMNLVSYAHASLPHVTNSTNNEWELRLWGPIGTLEPAPSLLRAGYTKSCDFVSVARFLLLVFLSPVFSWASILRLRHSFEIIQNRVTCSDLK